jgi:hypothetical protein
LSVPILNDTGPKSNETFSVSLSNPVGALLGTASTATVTIFDDDAGGAANPVDNTRFFVRQLYVDLLSREPDPAGWDGWTNRINLCGQPGQIPPPCDRVTVGGDGFLRSGEFFDRQFFVLRLYRTAHTSTTCSGSMLERSLWEIWLTPSSMPLSIASGSVNDRRIHTFNAAHELDKR